MVCQCCRQASPFLRELINACERLRCPQHRTAVRGRTKQLLTWWRQALPLLPARWLWPQLQPQVVVETDACVEGGAAIVHLPAAGSTWLYVRWQQDWPEVSERHINYKELAVALLAVRHFARQLSGCHVTLLSDNTAACGILRKWSSADSWATQELQQTALTCMQAGITVTAQHVPGQFEILADPASRMHQQSQLLNFICRFYGSLQVSANEFSAHAMSQLTAGWLRQSVHRLQQRNWTAANSAV
jgi:hypothetical protein